MPAETISSFLIVLILALATVGVILITSPQDPDDE